MKKLYPLGELVNYEGRTAIKVGEKYLDLCGIGFNYEDAVKIANNFCKKVIDLTKKAQGVEILPTTTLF